MTPDEYLELLKKDIKLLPMQEDMLKSFLAEEKEITIKACRANNRYQYLQDLVRLYRDNIDKELKREEES